MALVQGGLLSVRLRIKRQGKALDGLTCTLAEDWEVVSFGPQGWNPERDGWQPFLLVIRPSNPRNVPDTITVTFDREVLVGPRDELIELEE